MEETKKQFYGMEFKQLRSLGYKPLKRNSFKNVVLQNNLPLFYPYW